MMKNKRFDRIYDEYYDMIMHFVQRRTGDIHASEEICQQVYSSFYKNMETISDEVVRTWLFRCAANASVDFFRRRQIARDIFDSMPYLETGNVMAKTELELFEDKLVNQEFLNKVLLSVKEKNENWYEVLELCCIEELSCREASKMLGVSEDVVRARLHRARMYVNKCFGEEYRHL